MGKKSRGKKESDGSELSIKKTEGGLASILWKIIFAGTCLILFTPFVVGGKYFFPFVGIKSIYFMGLAEMIFAAWLILAISSPRYRPRLNALTIMLFLFLGIQAVSSFLGVDFLRSFWSKYERMTGLLMQIHLFSFFLVISSVFRRKEDWLKIFSVSVAAAVLMSVISFFPKTMGILNSASGHGATTGNSSFLGTYLLFNFFFALYVFFNSKSGFKIVASLAAIIIFISLFFSTARAALLSTIGGLILLILLWFVFSPKRKLKLIGISLFVILFAAIGISSFFISKPDSILHKIVIDNISGPTFGGRLIVWEGAWKGFLEKPLFGWGPENFEIVFTKYFNSCMLGPDCGGDIWYDRAHNIIFDTLVTTGIVGMIFYLGIFVTIFYLLWKKFSQKAIGFWTAGLSLTVLLSYFIQNLTVFDMVNSYMLFFLFLGFIGCIVSTRDDEENAIPKNKPIGFLTAGFVLILFFSSFLNFVIRPEQADRNIITSLNLPVGTQERIDSYKRTLGFSPVGRYQIRDFFAQNFLEFAQSDKLSQTTKEGFTKELNFLIAELEKSVNESPLDFRSYLKLGQLYNIYTAIVDSSKITKAETVLEKAIEVSPTNQQGYWSLAQTKIYEGQLEQALSLAEQALSLEPKSAQSNLIVIQIAKIMGNSDLVEQKAKEAIEANPSLEASIKNLLSQ